MIQCDSGTYTTCNTSARLVFASPADLRLETGLDRVDGPARSARLARHEEDTVLLREDRVRRLARLAGDILDWIAPLDERMICRRDSAYRCIDAGRAQFASAGSDP